MLPLVTFAARGRRRMTARAVIVFPEPLSPTMPRTVPASRLRLTPSTAGTSPFGPGKQTVRSSISNSEVVMGNLYNLLPRISLMPSLKRLSPRTAKMTARPGKMPTHGTVVKYPLFSANMLPQEGTGGLMPKPK